MLGNSPLVSAFVAILAALTTALYLELPWTVADAAQTVSRSEAAATEENSATIALRGVVLADPPTALISINDRPERVYEVGDEVMPKVIVKEIHQWHIVLDKAGSITRLPLRGGQKVNLSHVPEPVSPSSAWGPAVSVNSAVGSQGGGSADTTSAALPDDGLTEKERRIQEESLKPEKQRASIDLTPSEQRPIGVNNPHDRQMQPVSTGDRMNIGNSETNNLEN